jgi:hypothetical protein
MQVLAMVSGERTGLDDLLSARLLFRANPVRGSGLEILGFEVAKIASQALPLRSALAALSSCHCATAMACTSLASSDASVPVWVTGHVHVHTQHHLLDLSPQPSTGTNVVCFEPVQKLRRSRYTRGTHSSIGHTRLIACDTFPLPS